MIKLIPSVWKKSLLLLAVTASRREAVIAFVQTALLPNPLATTSSSSSLLAGVDLATAPLSELIDLESSYHIIQEDSDATTNTDTDTTVKKNGAYQLVSPVADEIPLEEGQRLVCIGDVHGDFQALEEFLTTAQVYDPVTHKWTGGNTILVQCGDVLDRGSQELQCFDLLTHLSQQSVTQGGAVILLWGNHEALNAGGMFHYTTGEFEYEQNLGKSIDAQLASNKWRVQYAGNQPARWAAYEPGAGVLAHPLLSHMKVAVKVGRTVCVHAGLTSKHLDDFGGLRGMNKDAQNWMKQAYMKNNNFGNYNSREELVAEIQRRAQGGASTMPEVLGGNSGADSPVWMRTYSDPNDKSPSDPKAQQMIDAALFHLGGDRMVMGHTVQKQINSALQGKAWRVDVGASKGVMGGTPEVLEVVMKDGKEVVSILTRGGGKVPAVDRSVDTSLASAVSSFLSG